MRYFSSLIRLSTFIALLAASSAFGTDRYFDDLSVLSADGKLRLEAKSPDNIGKYPRAFAASFEYKLFDVATSKAIWSKKQTEEEGSPVAAFVHQDGTVVVYTGYQNLLVLKAQGAVSLKLKLLRDALPAEDVKSYVSQTTAGPMWTGCSHWYFFAVGPQEYFGIRTWWDRRIIVSLSANKQVSDEGDVSQAATATEKAFVLTTLQKGAEVARKWTAMKLPEYSHHEKGPWHEGRDLWSAIHMAGRMGIKDAVPFLLEIEKVPSFDSSTSANEDVPIGKLMVATCSSDSTRRIVQLSLRRLGGTPAGYPVTEMKLSGEETVWGTSYRPRKYTTPRAGRVALVVTSMEPKAVVDIIGAPDYIPWANLKFGEADHAWDYDIDADSPYTLHIVWLGSKMVRKEIIKPPVWKDGKTRDMEH